MTSTYQSIRLGAGISMLCLLFGWLAPNHYFPWQAFWNDAPVGVALWVLFLSLALGLGTRVVVQVRAIALALLALLPWGQYWAGQVVYLGDAWIVSLYLFGAAAAYLAGQWIRAAGVTLAVALEAFAGVCLLASIFSSWLALRQAFGLNGEFIEVAIPYGSRTVANLAQPNQLSSLILLGVVSGFYLWTRRRFSVPTLLLVVFLLGLALASAQSRTAVLVFLVLLCWLFKGLVLSGEPVDRRGGWVFLSSISLVALLWFGWPFAYAHWLDVYVIPRTTADPARFLLLSQLLEASFLSPVFGYGWNQIPAAQVAVVNQYPSSLYVESSHNVMLDIVLWNGWPLGAAMIGVLTIWSISWLNRCTSVNQWYCLSLILILVVHSMLEYPLHYAYFLLPVCLIAGLLDTERTNLRMMRLSNGIVLGFFLVGTIGLGMVLRDYAIAENQIRESRFIAARFMGATSSATTASDTNGGGGRSSDILVLTQLTVIDKLSMLSPYDVRLSLDQAYLQQAVERYPWTVVLFHLSISFFEQGNDAVGNKYMCMIRRLHGEKAFETAMHFFKERQQSLRLVCEP